MKTIAQAMAVLLVVAFALSIAPPAVEAAPEAADTAVEAPAAQEGSAAVLDDELRDELRSRSTRYDGDYAGSGGRSSNVTIHWPTVLLIVIIIILL